MGRQAQPCIGYNNRNSGYFRCKLSFLLLPLINLEFVRYLLFYCAFVFKYKFNTNMTDENEQLMNKYDPLTNRLHELTNFITSKFLKNSSNWNKYLVRMLKLVSRRITYSPSDSK